MQVRAVGRRGKKGLVAASQTTVQFKGSSSRLLGAPQISQDIPACAQLLAGAANRKHGPGANAGWTSAAGAPCGCKKHLHGLHSCSFQQNSCYYPFQYRAVVLRFQYLRPPHTKQREVNTQLQRSVEWGEYFFFLSLFIFYIVQHKMPALHF